MGLGRLLLAGVRLEDVPAMLSRLLQVSQADKGLNPSKTSTDPLRVAALV